MKQDCGLTQDTEIAFVYEGVDLLYRYSPSTIEGALSIGIVGFYRYFPHFCGICAFIDAFPLII